MRNLTPEHRALLSMSERAAFAIADRVNRGPRLKAAATQYLRSVARPFVRLSSGRLLHQAGLENLTALNPDRGVLLASNHRSFFDLYVVGDELLRACDWVERMYFPVRSDYFYTHATGTLVNAAMSMLSMYPPIFRDPKKRALNDYAIEFLKEEGARRGTVIGIHPEGRRNTGDDPYEMLPAKPGTGEIIYHANPIVVPAFQLGMINSFPAQFKGNYDGTGDRITVVYGKPLDLSAYLTRPACGETYRAISDAVRDAILDIAEEEKVFRKGLGLPPARPLTAHPGPRATPPTSPRMSAASASSPPSASPLAELLLDRGPLVLSAPPRRALRRCVLASSLVLFARMASAQAPPPEPPPLPDGPTPAPSAPEDVLPEAPPVPPPVPPPAPPPPTTTPPPLSVPVVAPSATPRPPPPLAPPAGTPPPPPPSPPPVAGPVEPPAKADDDDQSGLFGPLRLGPVVGVGVPNLISFGGTAKLTKFLGFGVNVGVIPKVRLSLYGDATLSYQEYDVYGRFYPFGGAFFLGAGVGYATITGSYRTTMVAPAEAGPFAGRELGLDGEGKVRGMILTPQIGFFKTFGNGFSIGVDLGAQVPVAPSKVDVDTMVRLDGAPITSPAVEENRTQASAKVRDTLEKVGQQVLPTLNFKVGFLL